MKTSAIIFDFGGVLLRTRDHSLRIKWEEKLGLKRWEFEDYIFNGPVGRKAQLGQTSWDEVWADAGEKFQLSAAETAQAQQDFFGGDALDEDLAALIRQLKARYTIGLLSNTWFSDGWAMLRQFNIANAFHFTLTSAEVGVMKPDARIYQIALERAGAAPSQTIFVDDSEQNILAAHQLGMQTIHFVDPEAVYLRLAELREFVAV
ncbi:MAG TPA: HAD family phosphatase [Chloroflexi bacterium]|nr:MAG: hypothetical protein B6243_04580 [Anaerolineaceae bacterium 4572_5.2]HEY84408.1 HAD family phosphatase [Chloroflexota bacterium]